MCWEEAWECLTRLAEHWQLVGVRLQVADEHGCRELRWEAGEAAHWKESTWSLALAFALPDCPAQSQPATATTSDDDPANASTGTGSYCRLCVEGRAQCRADRGPDRRVAAVRTPFFPVWPPDTHADGRRGPATRRAFSGNNRPAASTSQSCLTTPAELRVFDDKLTAQIA